MNIYLIELNSCPIEKQLDIEFSLLKNDPRSFLLINKNPPETIVMGSSQKEDEVVHPSAKEKNIPIIRRFSSGGCVIFDHNTILVSLIIHQALAPIKLYPSSIMQWSAEFYQQALKIPSFKLVENDYVISKKKVGGNAQYIKKDRFIHHSSFLWDFDPGHLNLLHHPPKEPDYRNKRTHTEFLTTLKPHVSKQGFVDSIKHHTTKRFNLCSLEGQIYD